MTRRRYLPPAGWIAATVSTFVTFSWVNSSLTVVSLLALLGSFVAWVAATIAVILAVKDFMADPPWLRAASLLIVATLALAAGVEIVLLILLRGDWQDATLSAVILWFLLHSPALVFLPRGTSWQTVAVWTSVQWILIAAIVAKVTTGARTSHAIARSVGTILLTAAVMIAAFLFFGLRPNIL
jgi:hypothetical protein